eukprot:6534464-Alexandrium_andersonii.AAC.1
MRTEGGKNIRVYNVGVAMATLLRHGPGRHVRHLMDTAGWASAELLLDTPTMKRNGELPKGTLPHGVGPRQAAHPCGPGPQPRCERQHRPPQALQVVKPGDPDWVAVGLRGTRGNLVPNILREGLDTKHSTGKEKRTHVHLVPKARPGLAGQPGLRRGSTAVAAVDLAALHAAGATIYRSVIDVILTSGFVGSIPPQFTTRVLRLRDKHQMWPVEEAPISVAMALAAERRETASTTMSGAV